MQAIFVPPAPVGWLFLHHRRPRDAAGDVVIACAGVMVETVANRFSRPARC
jgi:hypothetical protein